jgi:hypothetical protein
LWFIIMSNPSSASFPIGGMTLGFIPSVKVIVLVPTDTTSGHSSNDLNVSP